MTGTPPAKRLSVQELLQPLVGCASGPVIHPPATAERQDLAPYERLWTFIIAVAGRRQSRAFSAVKHQADELFAEHPISADHLMSFCLSLYSYVLSMQGVWPNVPLTVQPDRDGTLPALVRDGHTWRVALPTWFYGETGRAVQSQVADVYAGLASEQVGAPVHLVDLVDPIGRTVTTLPCEHVWFQLVQDPVFRQAKRRDSWCAACPLGCGPIQRRIRPPSLPRSSIR